VFRDVLLAGCKSQELCLQIASCPFAMENVSKFIFPELYGLTLCHHGF
jgi:hypothetical protein